MIHTTLAGIEPTTFRLLVRRATGSATDSPTIYTVSPCIYGRRAFAVAGPTAWNSLSDDMRDPTLSTDSFRRLLKTWLFSE